MSESKKIVDGGTDILSNFYSYAENVSVTNEFSAKVKDRPQERRPGLGIARKKASFSLKTGIRCCLKTINSKLLEMFSGMESNVEFDSTTPPFCNLETQKVIGNADGLPEQFEDENARIPSMDAITTQTEESDNIGNAMNTNGNQSNPFVVDEEARDDTSTRRKINPEQQPEVHAAKRQRGERAAGVRIRDAHPMTKSLAEAGTSFETGVRRSKRVKMRPLEYWKGERFLHGHVDNSLKLIGVKCFSPGKGNENLKVIPYILSEKPEYKEVLDLAARH